MVSGLYPSVSFPFCKCCGAVEQPQNLDWRKFGTVFLQGLTQ
jgi:hypothetical protein